MKKLLPLILVFALVFAGCQSTGSAQKKQMQTYINKKAGYVVLLPHEWQKKYENSVSTGFVGDNPNIAMDIVFEIGGFDYFSLDSLGDVVIKNYKNKFKNVKVIEKGVSNINNDAYRVILQGKNAENKDVVVKTIFFEPAIGIRYYLAFAANPKDYYANDYLFEDIAQSFQMTETDQDLYKLLKNREEEEFKKKHKDEIKKANEKKKADEKYKEELDKQKEQINKSN